MDLEDILASEPAGDTSGNYVMPDPYTSSGISADLLTSLKGLLSGKSGTASQLASLGGIGALLNKVMGGGGGGPSGYQGSIPKYTASREQYAIPPSTSQSAYRQPEPERPNYDAMLARLGGSPQGMAGIGALSSSMARPISQTPAQQSSAPRRPGSGGVTYFSPMQYVKQEAAPTAEQPMVQPTQPEQGNPTIVPTYAYGGITTLGSYSDGGRLLRGPGDGVSDSIPATIGKNQPARLADGEFVVPARIVSELGNGSTEAGARKLYAMMDRIKKTRAKAKNIAANTKADKHLPA
jgi:hypothetical protein